MAYTDMTYWASIERTAQMGASFYNIDNPIFQNKSGDDVLLVQYLLWMDIGAVTNLNRGSWPKQANVHGFNPNDYGSISSEFDGIYSPRTRNAILCMEKFLRSTGIGVVPDGIVRPVLKGEKFSSQTHTYYKPGLFNFYAHEFAKKISELTLYDKMPNHINTPKRLQTALQHHIEI